MPKLLTRKQNRLPNYDYSNEGFYFVTICSKDRKNIFAKINNKDIVGTGLVPVRIELTKIGEIIDKQWKNIKNQYDNVELDEYIIMPNHIHGILIINKRDGASPSPTLNQMVGSFKSKCVVEYLKSIRENDFNISGQIWQRSFYDHVIRNERSLLAIRDYIIKNLENWEKDKDNINKTV